MKPHDTREEKYCCAADGKRLRTRDYYSSKSCKQFNIFTRKFHQLRCRSECTLFDSTQNVD